MTDDDTSLHNCTYSGTPAGEAYQPDTHQHTLRDRIAAAIRQAHSELHFSLSDTWDDKCLRLADAVIKELGLQKTLERIEIVERDGELSVVHGRCRYITEWSDDD